MTPDCHPTAFTDGAKGSLRLLAVERLALFAILAVICLLAVAGVTVALAQDSTGRRFVAAAVIAAVFGGAVCVVLMVDSVRRPGSAGGGWIWAVAAAGGLGSLLSALNGLYEAIIFGFAAGFVFTWIPVLGYFALRPRSDD
jgi:hypothetical protein